jgi:preprotein translocase subunit Sec61beta
MDKKGQKGIRMPSGMGGIVRYFEDYKSKVEIKPEYVVYVSALFIIAVIILKHLG